MTENETYHFARVACKNDGSDGVWYFVARNKTQVLEHWEKYAASEIKGGMRELVDYVFNDHRGHMTNTFGEMVKFSAQIKGMTYFGQSAQLENELLRNRLNDFREYGEVWLSHGLTVFGYTPELHVIREEVDSDKLVFPDEIMPTMADVRYIMWDGGKHWYAKIGKIDIVDENGHQKWDTKAEAERAAKRYIELNY